jgi:crotonobetainyl-CoA:carnitine CoA-transferase CaiB-like acyl-CoA transferase
MRLWLQVNPNVVYASVTGFGATGPKSHMPATDTVMQGYTGLMNINRDDNRSAAPNQYACH